MHPKTWIAVLALLAACESSGPKPYAACETADDCAGLRGEQGVAECLLLYDVKICAWHCETDADCASDEAQQRSCAAIPESPGDALCLPSCADASVAALAAACPDGYTCGGDDACFPRDVSAPG